MFEADIYTLVRLMIAIFIYGLFLNFEKKWEIWKIIVAITLFILSEVYFFYFLTI